MTYGRINSVLPLTLQRSAKPCLCMAPILTNPNPYHQPDDLYPLRTSPNKAIKKTREKQSGAQQKSRKLVSNNAQPIVSGLVPDSLQSKTQQDKDVIRRHLSGAACRMGNLSLRDLSQGTPLPMRLTAPRIRPYSRSYCWGLPHQ